MQNNAMQAALDYTGRGFSVIPIRGDKKPFLPWTAYQKRRATADEIKSWWAKWPGAMVGIVTGEVSGVFVVDCDTPEGFEAVQKLIPETLLMPTVRTPRGGWHLYFRWLQDYKLTVGAGIMPGVDFRGEGGYIIAPPSVNADGKAYAWQEGLSLDVELPGMPGALSSALNIKNINSIEACIADTAKTEKLFTEGRRDNDLFHVANCLTKSGMPPGEIFQVLENLIISWGEKPDAKWISDKIESAKKRDSRRSGDVTKAIEEWVSVTDGYFSVTDCSKALQSVTDSEHTTFRVILHRLAKRGIIEKHGNKDGVYRRIETDIEAVNFLTAPTDEFSITWPMDIHDHCIIYPGNIVIVAGSKSAGKTSFLLNTVKLNMQRHEVVYLNSEMGDTEFRKRLELFEDAPLSSWNFRAYHRASTFADLITPEKKIFIVDFLEVTTDFWKVAQYIQEIHKKLKDGIAVIALQKADGRDAGRGGDFSKEKARLYLSLDYLHDQKVNRIKITDAKAWRTDRNPRGMYRDYKLVKGSHFIPVGYWKD